MEEREIMRTLASDNYSINYQKKRPSKQDEAIMIYLEARGNELLIKNECNAHINKI